MVIEKDELHERVMKMRREVQSNLRHCKTDHDKAVNYGEYAALTKVIEMILTWEETLNSLAESGGERSDK